MTDTTPPPARFRCIAVVAIGREASMDEAQAAWQANDPFATLKARGATRYTRALSLGTELPAFRQRGRIGAAHLWAASAADALALARHIQSPAFAAASPLLREAKLTVLATREYPLIGPVEDVATDTLKSLFLVTRKPGMSVADYQRHWLHVHAPLVNGADGLTRYCQCQRLPESYAGDDTGFDGAAEMTWPDDAARQAFDACEPHRSKMIADLPNLWDMQAGMRFLTREEGIF